MRGSGNIRFVELVRDTIQTHGIKWACEYYYARMEKWEARFWLKQACK